MGFSIVKICGILFGVFVAGESAKLPSSWGICSKSDRAFSECIRKNIEIAVRSMRKPPAELASIGSFDPLNIPELYIGEGKGPVNVAQHFKNVKVHGLTNVDVLKAEFDWDKKLLYSESLSPELRLEADYIMKGRVLLLPIVGHGPCNVTLVNMRIKHYLTFDYIEKKGKTFMKAVDFRVTMSPERVIFKFDNLFNGENNELGDNINKILNDNSLEVFNDVREGYEKSFGLIFRDLANRVFFRIPLKDMFLE